MRRYSDLDVLPARQKFGQVKHSRREITAFDVREFTDDVALRGVLAHEELRELYRASDTRLIAQDARTHPEACSKYAAALLHGTSHLGRGLPNDLSEMRWNRVVRVVLG